MEDRPTCTCGSPVRQKGKRQNGTPVWRSKCSRCEMRVVDTMVSTDLVEEMQRTQALRGELQALQVEIEEQKKRILKIEAEKVDLGSTLEKERQDRADAEDRLKAHIERASAQVQMLRDEREYSKKEIKALEAKIGTMRELAGEADEKIKAQGLQIQSLQAELADRDEQVEDLQQIVENLTKESKAHLATLTEERSAWSQASVQMAHEREESRRKEARAASVIEAERGQVNTLRAEQRKLTLALKGVGAGFVLLILGAALWGAL